MAFALSFAVYTLLIVAVGVYSARYARDSNEDYFLAGRSLGPWVAALSASASSESGWVTLGLVGWAFTGGMSAYWIIPGCLFGFFFNWFVIAGRLRTRSGDLGATTLPDFFALSFGERRPIVRTLSVIVIFVAMMLYVAAQFAAAGHAFQTSFDALDYRVGVVIGAVIVLAYTVLGGFRAACWTDFVQGLIMIGTLIIFPAWLLFSYGGYGFIHEQLGSTPETAGLLRFTPERAGLAFVGFLLGSGALGINFGYPGQPHVLVRFMALRDPKEARIGGIVSMVWASGVYWGAVTVGLLLRALTEGGGLEWTAPLAADLAAGTSGAGEQGLVLAARELLPGVISGMVLAAVLAAICSTADSQLVVAGSATANDLYARLFRHDRPLHNMLVNRASIFVIGIIAALLVFDTRVQVYTYVLTYGWAILGASFGPQLILLLFWKRASYAGCVAGMLTGFIVAIVWQQVYDAGVTGIEIYNLPFAFLCALIVNVAVSLIAPERGAVTEGPSMHAR